MAKFKIELDKESCIGCGACAVACGDFWKLGDSGKSVLKGAKATDSTETLELDDVGCNQQAAEACPVNAIHIYDLKTNKKLI